MANDVPAGPSAAAEGAPTEEPGPSAERIARLHEVINECTKNTRIALAVALSATLYQLAAVVSVTPRDILGDTQQLTLPLIGARTRSPASSSSRASSSR